MFFFKMQSPFSVPLGIAAEKGYTDTVKELLQAGAKVNYRNKVTMNAVYLITSRMQCIVGLLHGIYIYIYNYI